jgi:phospholipid/cholesterol/gamma-HCH transport system substrate-binding protein
MSNRRRDFKRRQRSNVIWGLAASAAVLAAAWWAFLSGGEVPLVPRSGFEVKAVVASANELRGRAPVRIAGVEVGRVDRIGRGPGATALVTMRLRDGAAPLHRDATLKIRPRLFLEGNFFVDLEPGSPSAPELGDGGTIPLAQTATPVQLDQVLTALQSDTRDDLTTVVKELGGTLGARPGAASGGSALGRALDELGPAGREGARTMSALRGLEPDDLSSVVREGGRVTAALDARREQLAGTIEGFDRTVTALASEEAALTATLRTLAPTLEEALPAVREVRAALPATRAFARDVRPLLRRAPRTLDLARPLLRELRGLIRPSELPALSGALRPPVRTLRALQPDLEALLDLVTPVTDCVRDRALPPLSTPVEDGKHTSGQAPWQELLHVMGGLAGASQNFDGNGTAVRYMAGFGEQLISTGRLPSAGRLQGLTQAPLEGARPAPPKSKPPFRPDAECRKQKLVDLKAEAVGAPPAQRAPAVSRRDERLLEDALRAARADAREARR